MTRIPAPPALAVLLLLNACDGSGGSSTDGTGSDRSLLDGALSDGRPADGAHGDGSASPLAQCLKQQASITLACTSAGTFEYVVAGKAFSCLATQAFSKPKLRFLFKLSEVVGGEPQIRKLRISDKQTPAAVDDLVEFSAPSPAPLSTLPLKLDWEAFIRPMAFAGGLTFVEARAPGASVTLDPFDTQKLAGGTPVRGSFTLKGGTYVVLDGQGVKQTVKDPQAEGKGCFNLDGLLDAML